jgi:hypothetical protein
MQEILLAGLELECVYSSKELYMNVPCRGGTPRRPSARDLEAGFLVYGKDAGISDWNGENVVDAVTSP